MEPSTKAKTAEEKATICTMYNDGVALLTIARKMHFSINTVRKIVRANKEEKNGLATNR